MSKSVSVLSKGGKCSKCSKEAEVLYSLYLDGKVIFENACGDCIIKETGWEIEF